VVVRHKCNGLETKITKQKKYTERHGGFFAASTSFLREAGFLDLTPQKNGREMRKLSVPIMVGTFLVCSNIAVAQESNLDSDNTQYMFNVEVLDGVKALSEISDVTGRSLIFSHKLVEGVQTNKLSGEYSVKEALKLMLDGTGLIAKISDYGVILVTKAEVKGVTEKSNKAMNKKVRLLSGADAAFETVSAPVFAQTANTLNDEIIVTGIKKSLRDARNQKRNSSGVVDAIAAKEIGQLPDTNLAESLQRITGVSIDRSGGEGQFITVRGFGPQFNTVLVNGRQIASEDLSRAFAFDTIASELVSNIQVNKTSTSVLQSGGIGSTVNIATARPLDSQGLRVAGSVGGTYDNNTENITPKISGVVSNTSDDGRFGIFAALSYSERDTRLNQVQSDGWLENVGVPQAEINNGAGFAGNIFSPRNLDNKVTFEKRERLNGNLVLQFAPNDETEVTLDALYSDFDIDTDATSFGHWFTAPNVRDVMIDPNGTVVDLYQEVGLATDFHSKTFDRLTETISLGLNVKKSFSDNLMGSIDASFSKAEREANNGGENQLTLIGYANRVRFQSDDEVLPWVTNFAEANPNIFSGQQEIDGIAYQAGTIPAGVGDYLDTDNSRAHVMLRRGWAVDDEVKQLRGDLAWDQGNDTGLISLKSGLQYSNEKKALVRFDNEGQGLHCRFCGYPDSPPVTISQSVFDAGDDFLSGVGGSDRLVTRWLRHDGEAQFASLEAFGGINLDAERRGNSFVVNENIVSAYVESDWVGEISGIPISAVVGARLEETDVTIDGTAEDIINLEIVDQTEMILNRGSVKAVSFDNSYTTVLPNMSLKLDANDDLVFRFAASRTITRPTLTSLSPVLNITTTRQGGDLRAEGGNPSLKPFKSDNIDFSAEYYYGDSNYVSVGIFHKEVGNFIVTGQASETINTADGSLLTDPSAGNSVANFTVARPINGDDASVTGVEAAIQHNFGDTGFGIQLNGTLVDGSVKLDPGDVSQIFALTGLSNSANAVAYYDKGPVEIRVAYNWRDKFLQSLSQTAGNGVTNVRAFDQIDLSARYRVTDNIEIYVEGLNLANEKLLKYGRFENHFLYAEDSGRRFNVGSRFSF
jgi:TonB-dependent receptor